MVEDAEDDYKTAREKYDENFENYKNTSRYSDEDVIVALLDETLETSKAIAEAVKSEVNILDYLVDCRSEQDLPIFYKVTEYQTNLKSYTSQTNSYLLNLLSTQRTIEDKKETKSNAEQDITEMDQNNPLDLAAAERNIEEKEESLARLKAGPDEFDIRAKNIAIQQKKDALLSAQQNLADYYIRAPFDGIVAEVNIRKGESSSSASITLATKQKIAEITLNEIDVAKIEIGQKVNITFDAIDGLNITGKVAEVDTLGAVSQGVVTYNVKIAFDTQDERVKSGMSISAEIITKAKQGVLLVPNSAVKYQDNVQFVEIMENNIPRLKLVEIGISNDTMSEVVEGLQEGDQIVTQTISAGSAQNKQTGSKLPGFGGQQMMKIMR